MVGRNDMGNLHVCFKPGEFLGLIAHAPGEFPGAKGSGESPDPYFLLKRSEKSLSCESSRMEADVQLCFESEASFVLYSLERCSRRCEGSHVGICAVT